MLSAVSSTPCRSPVSCVLLESQQNLAHSLWTSLAVSYAILITTWLGFEFFISIQQVLLRRGETWHFIEQ